LFIDDRGGNIRIRREAYLMKNLLKKLVDAFRYCLYSEPIEQGNWRAIHERLKRLEANKV